ncbi:hypothetical protein [Nocardia salmonicida]|uniref:hypothetical protein n=1 Tax=Nocardia salmonicida TaxID=53431 RepID=UPI003CEF02D3
MNWLVIVGLCVAAVTALYFGVGVLLDNREQRKRASGRARASARELEGVKRQIQMNTLNELHQYNKEAREQFTGLRETERRAGEQLDDAARHYKDDNAGAFWDAIIEAVRTLTIYGAEIGSLSSIKNAFEHTKGKFYKGADAPTFDLSPASVSELRSVEQKSTRLALLVQQALANPRFSTVQQQRSLGSTTPEWSVAERLDALKQMLTTH